MRVLEGNLSLFTLNSIACDDDNRAAARKFKRHHSCIAAAAPTTPSISIVYSAVKLTVLK